MDSNTVSSLRTSPATNKEKPNQIKAKQTNKNIIPHTHTKGSKKGNKIKHKAQVILTEMVTAGTDVTK